MRLFLLSISLASIIMVPFPSVADTVILKNGCKVEATKCWEEGNLIKCKVYGQTVGYEKSNVAEIRMDDVSEMPVAGFRFGIWQSGISVNEAIDIAEANDLPFLKGGLVSIIKTFHPEVCRPYADTATQFYYKGQIFGKEATLNFDFTTVSKKLYSLNIAFAGTGISKKSEFRDRIEAMLREKYGNPIKIIDHIVYKTYDWKISDNAIVTMRPGTNYVLVTYRDIALAKLAEDEKLDQVRKGFTKNDRSKF